MLSVNLKKDSEDRDLAGTLTGHIGWFFKKFFGDAHITVICFIHFHFQLKKVVLIRSYFDIFGIIKYQTLEAIDGLFIISF